MTRVDRHSDVGGDLAALEALARAVQGWATPREIHKALAGQLDLFAVGVRREDQTKSERKDRAAGQGFLFDDQD